MKCRLIGIGSEIYHNNCEMLGLEMLMASMLAKGINAEIVYYEYDAGKTIKEFCKRYEWHDVALVAFSLFYTTFDIASDIIEKVKEVNNEILFCAGGTAVSHAASECLDYMFGLDFVIRGEGELTICEIMEKLSEGKNWKTSCGITYRGKNNIITNEARDLVEDLDKLPWAKRTMLDIYRLKKVRIQTARGCEGNCTFCAESRVFDLSEQKNAWRGRSVNNIIDEIEYIVSIYNVNFFSIVDESYEDPVSAGGFKRIEKICDEILTRNIDIYYEVLMRAENILRIPMGIWIKMKKSGLVGVLLGIESGSESALRTYGKIATVNQNMEAYQFLDEQLGINVIAGFIMFNPYSTMDEYYENMQFIKKMNLQYSFRVFSNKVHIFCNTPLYRRVKKDFLLKDTYDISRPLDYGFVDKEVEMVSTNIDKLINIVDGNGRGEYVTDYYHDTYERVVMYEKNGNVDMAKDLKREMREIRKKMGQYIIKIFDNIGQDIDMHKIKELKCIMSKYEESTLQDCNKVLRRILKHSGDMSRTF